VRRFLEEGERTADGRKRYKIWEIEAFPGGLAPSPYDGAFWRSDPARGIHCEINRQSSSARWTGAASAEWTAFDGRRTASYDLRMIRLNHDLFVEFLQSAGVPSLPPLPPLSTVERATVVAEFTGEPVEPIATEPVESTEEESSEKIAETAEQDWDPSDWSDVKKVMLNLEIGGWAVEETVKAVEEMPTKTKPYRGKRIPQILDKISAADLHRTVKGMGYKMSPDSCEKLVSAWKAWRTKQPARDS